MRYGVLRTKYIHYYEVMLFTDYLQRSTDSTPCF